MAASCLFFQHSYADAADYHLDLMPKMPNGEVNKFRVLRGIGLGYGRPSDRATVSSGRGGGLRRRTEFIPFGYGLLEWNEETE